VIHYLSKSVVLTVQATPTLTFSAPVSVPFGAPATVTVTVTNPGGAAPPGGSITFHNGTGGPVLATVPLTPVISTNMSTATLTVPPPQLSVGAHDIEAVYSGDPANNLGSASQTAPAEVTVTKAGTTITLTETPPSPAAGGTVTLTANIAVTAPGAGTPGGTVTFQDLFFAPDNTTTTPTSTTTVKVANVTGSANAGTASAVTGPLAVGTHKFQAVYNGDPNFAGSGPQTLTVTVAQPALTGPADITALVNPQLGPVTPVRKRGRKVPGKFQQTVTIMNTGSVPIQGNIVLVLSNLKPQKKFHKKVIPLVTVLNATGKTQTVSPGSPFVSSSTSLLPPGAQTTFTLLFKTTGPGKPSFTPQVLVGYAQP
jgi:hypothetical protein